MHLTNYAINKRNDAFAQSAGTGAGTGAAGAAAGARPASNAGADGDVAAPGPEVVHLEGGGGGGGAAESSASKRSLGWFFK